MINLKGKFPNTASGRMGRMFMLHRIKTQIIIMAVNKCIESCGGSGIHHAAFFTSLVQRLNDAFFNTTGMEANAEEIIGYFGSLMVSGIVKKCDKDNESILFLSPEKEIVILIAEIREELKEYVAIASLDKWLDGLAKFYHKVKDENVKGSGNAKKGGLH